MEKINPEISNVENQEKEMKIGIIGMPSNADIEKIIEEIKKRLGKSYHGEKIVIVPSDGLEHSSEEFKRRAIEMLKEAQLEYDLRNKKLIRKRKKKYWKGKEYFSD